MILWRLRGYADPEGECEGGEVVCSVDKWKGGYRLLVEHAGRIETDESHPGSRNQAMAPVGTVNRPSDR